MQDRQRVGSTSARAWERACARPWLARGCALFALALAFSVVLLTPRVARAADATVLEDLNLRSGPGLEYDVIAVLPPGAVVAILDEPVAGWYPVLYADLEGWASGAYLAIADDGSVEDGDVATVVAAALNLRDGPGLDYAVVAQLPYGTTVEIIGGPEEADGYTWVQVRVPSGCIDGGWIAAEFLFPGGATGAGWGIGCAAP